MKKLAGADVVFRTEGRVAAPPWPGACDPAGVGDQGTFTSGFPRNLGGPSIFSADSRREVPGDQLQAHGRRIRRSRERNSDATGIPPARRKRSAAGRVEGSRSVE